MKQDARIVRLARQAWARIQAMGMDPVESIARACVAVADGSERPLPPYLDRLPPTQRRVACALWAEARSVRIEAIAEALDMTQGNVCHTLRKLVRRGYARRVVFGVYALGKTKRATTTRGRQSVATERVPVEFVTRHGRAAPSDLARWQGVSCDTARQRLLAAVRRGDLRRIRRGVYGPVDRRGSDQTRPALAS